MIAVERLRTLNLIMAWLSTTYSGLNQQLTQAHTLVTKRNITNLLLMYPLLDVKSTFSVRKVMAIAHIKYRSNLFIYVPSHELEKY